MNLSEKQKLDIWHWVIVITGCVMIYGLVFIAISKEMAKTKATRLDNEIQSAQSVCDSFARMSDGEEIEEAYDFITKQ